MEIFANSVLGRALEASGLPRGKKTVSNPSLDPQMARDSGMTCYHVQATLNEEGGFYLTVNKQRRAGLGIAWGRSVDITDGLASMQVDELRRIEEEHGSKIPIRRITDPEILRAVKGLSPRLLDQELALLSNSHMDAKWPRETPTKVHVSRYGRVTTFWEVRTSRPHLIDIIHDEYGLLPGTWKAERFERLYQAYVKYRGRQLTDEEIQELRKIKEENPADISIDWISRKTQELFPDIEWGKDVDEIRRKIERKK